MRRVLWAYCQFRNRAGDRWQIGRPFFYLEKTGTVSLDPGMYTVEVQQCFVRDLWDRAVYSTEKLHAAPGHAYVVHHLGEVRGRCQRNTIRDADAEPRKGSEAPQG